MAMTLTTLRRPRPSPRMNLADAALGLARGWGWDVLPGTRLVRVGRETRCSCRRTGCTEPGQHPARRGWALDQPRPVPGWWERFPDTPVLLATGRDFDVIDVPAAAGARALQRLERMGARLGPVASTPTARLLFWVAPGAATSLPGLLARLGWDDPTELDIRCHGENGYVPAPPSPLGSSGRVSWVRAPETPCHLPEPRLLLGTIGRACHTAGYGGAFLGEPSGAWPTA